MSKMKIRKRWWGLVLVLGFVSAEGAWAQSKAARLEAFFDDYNQNGMFNGMVLAAEDGKIVFDKAYGFADFEKKTPFGPSSVFAIGSITKTYTAVAVMMLKEKGLLSYADPVSNFLPGWPTQAANITIRHLLTHTSGLPDVRGNKFKLFRQPQITSAAAWTTLVDGLQLEFQPGEKYSYSNSNYFLLGKIVEKVSGQSWRSFLEEKIFAPAGMKSTFIHDESADAPPNRVNAYAYYWAKTDYDQQDRVIGYGNIYSTVHDQFLFDQALYSDKIIRQETLQEAFDFSRYRDGGKGYRYGLGWRIHGEKEGRGVVAHRGSIGGFRGLLWRDLIRKNTLIVLSNNWWLSDVADILEGAEKIMEGQPGRPGKISGQALLLDNWSLYGFDAALTKMRRAVTEEADRYDVSQNLMNDLAYYFIYSRKEPGYAEKILEYALELHPKSDVLWDSLGEIRAMLGNTQAAIRCYEKSLELNPGNDNARKKIEELKAKR